MKKFLGILVVFAIAAAFSFSSVEAKGKKKIKENPCQKTCAASFVKCKKEAKKDREKRAVCEASKKECMDQCEKAVNEDKEGKGKKSKEDKVKGKDKAKTKGKDKAKDKGKGKAIDKAEEEIEEIEEDVTE
ncbi:MAG: hypothetical protein GXY14_01450 [Spirochaetes bacterium]|nr:hypothetical protein [Spirochaetota bacterium]